MAWTNVGEKEDLLSLINNREIFLGLYKNVVVPTDGSLTWGSISEMPTGGGRGYARIPLASISNFSGLAAGQWYLSLNASGKYQAQYNNAALQWTMTSVEVSDANTVQGVFGACWMLPFSNGSVQIAKGNLVIGATSGATATVTDVVLLSGTWGGGNATGYLYLGGKSGPPFQNGENLTIYGGGVQAVSASGTQNGGDAWIQLLFVASMATPTQVTSAGQPFVATPIISGGQDPTLS
jgi:hypothetical protein